MLATPSRTSRYFQSGSSEEQIHALSITESADNFACLTARILFALARTVELHLTAKRAKASYILTVVCICVY